MGVYIDLTDVTLVSEDTYGDDDEDEDLIHLFQLIHLFALINLFHLIHLCLSLSLPLSLSSSFC